MESKYNNGELIYTRYTEKEFMKLKKAGKRLNRIFPPDWLFSVVIIIGLICSLL